METTRTSKYSINHVRLLRIRLIVILIPVLLYISCTIRVYDAKRFSTDFKTEGFLDRDHFQVVIQGFPDKSKRGLVEIRESALANAKSNIIKKVVEKLSEYCINLQLRKINTNQRNKKVDLSKITSDLEPKLIGFYRSGYTAFEYHNEDNSAIIVYRVFKDGLKRKLESISDSIKFKNN